MHFSAGIGKQNTFKSIHDRTKLKEFQSLENDACHTVVFGNVATVVALCMMLHWTQMADQMCSKHEKHCFSHDLQKISKLRNFGKFLENFFHLNLFFS